MDDEDKDSKSLEETNEDDEIALLTRKYQRILRVKRGYGRKGDKIEDSRIEVIKEIPLLLHALSVRSKDTLSLIDQHI